MKSIAAFVTALLIILNPGAVPESDYGQETPGSVPVLFSPAYLKTGQRIHSSPAFSPGLTEVYWSVLPGEGKEETILYSVKADNKWSSPEIASFSGTYSDGGPAFSPDGTKLYFYSNRPAGETSDVKTPGEIWFVEKEAGKWGLPKHIGLDFEGEKIFFSVTGNYTIYFTSGHGKGGSAAGSVDIYRAGFINGAYTKPVKLPPEINSSLYAESDPLISPYENYLVFYSLERPENIGQYDLYVSYYVGNDRWTGPVNMGAEINKGYSRFPRFSPDGKYLFFVRQDGIYWIKSSIVHRYNK